RAEAAFGETLQAVQQHRKVGLFTDLGEADLSSHVDFGALARAAGEAGARTFGPIGQGTFLSALGIEARAERLMRGATAPQGESIEKAVARLVGADAMGTLFKALAIVHPALAPAGFPGERPLPRG